MRVAFLVLMFVIGACIGSYLCCQVRRLRLKSTRKKSYGPRSVCLSCKTKLKWYDNIPIISWLALKGKCRKCHHKIGILEIASEIGVATAFLLLSTTIAPLSATPLEWAVFITTLLFTTVICFLAIYDGAHGQLPSLCLTISIICAIIILSLKEWVILSNYSFSSNQIIFPLLSVFILGGLYLVIYLLSKGKWVGDGDWLLALAIGIVLADPWLALITLFLANFLALIFALPNYKKSRNHQIYFGPFLVAAFVITLTFANFFQSMI